MFEKIILTSFGGLFLPSSLISQIIFEVIKMLNIIYYLVSEGYMLLK